MPGSTGIELKPHGIGQAVGHPGTHPSDMNAMTKGCLAGTAVCFISHQGEVYPCGYLPALAGDLRKQPFADIWENSVVFNQLRDANNLKGKCGCCEFRNICMGCRARAFAATGNYLDEEPFCVYQPRTARLKEKDAADGRSLGALNRASYTERREIRTELLEPRRPHEFSACILHASVSPW